MARKTIISDLVAGLKALPNVTDASSRPCMPAAVVDWPYIAVVVDREDPLFEGANRYKTEVVLYILVKQDYNEIEDLIEDVKDYIKSAAITDVLELTYLIHEVVAVEAAQDIAAVAMRVTLIYKDDNNDTPANSFPTATPVGYMAIAKYKAYALMTSGSTTFQALGTNVYDSHLNANIEIPDNSGSISVDIIDAPVEEIFAGGSMEIRDDNAIAMSIRVHFEKGTTNTVIAPFMYSIVDEVRKNMNLGDVFGDGYNYRVLAMEFVPTFNLTFEESSTTGAELIFNINKAWSYTQA